MLAGFLLLAQIGCFNRAPRDPVADNLKLTRAGAPLPNDAYKALISFAYEAPEKIYAGESTSIHLLVTNVSNTRWPSEGQADGKYRIELGNRWLDQSGTASDDGRSSLSYDLEPGDTAELLLTVTAPEAAGNYILEFDLVQEQVTWFGNKGSETLRRAVRVE